MNWLFRLIDKKYKVALEDAENLRRENDDLKNLNQELKTTVTEIYTAVTEIYTVIDKAHSLAVKYNNVNKKVSDAADLIEEALKSAHLKYSHIGNSCKENHK